MKPLLSKIFFVVLFIQFLMCKQKDIALEKICIKKTCYLIPAFEGALRDTVNLERYYGYSFPNDKDDSMMYVVHFDDTVYDSNAFFSDSDFQKVDKKGFQHYAEKYLRGYENNYGKENVTLEDVKCFNKGERVSCYFIIKYYDSFYGQGIVENKVGKITFKTSYCKNIKKIHNTFELFSQESDIMKAE